MILDLPVEVLPQPGEEYPVLALTGAGSLLGYYPDVAAGLAAGRGGTVILYVASGS